MRLGVEILQEKWLKVTDNLLGALVPSYVTLKTNKGVVIQPGYPEDRDVIAAQFFKPTGKQSSIQFKTGTAIVWLEIKDEVWEELERRRELSDERQVAAELEAHRERRREEERQKRANASGPSTNAVRPLKSFTENILVHLL